MKKNKAVLILLLFFFLSCSSVNYFRVNVEVPGKPLFDINRFDEIIVTNFFIQREREDFNLNEELVNYFTTQMKQSFNTEVSSRRVALSDEELFNDTAYWKNLQTDSRETVFFTGTVDYLEEVRKAIIQTKKKADETFQRDKAIEERRFYTLTINFYLIDAQTGEVLFTKALKETRAYNNPNQTAAFAFFDLADIVKSKFFSTVLGTVKTQQRYLIKE